MVNNTLENGLEIKGLSGESLNILEEKINKIKEIFPEAICEGKIDFERLSEELGKFKEDKEERYRFEWAGKSEAIKIAQTPSMGTLRPCKEESKNWDRTENLYIEGDNLEVLKLLQKSYQNKVKMIYIDPPYNTGNDFVYKDDFKDNIENYMKITGQKDSEGNSTSTNKETNGRYHSDWLNMMYPRLKIARNLLSNIGVIYISIDSNEYENMKKVCNEVFGENNLISNMVWVNNERGRSIDKFISNTNEYILMYAKDINQVIVNQRKESGEDILKEYSLCDEYSFYKKGDPLFNNNSKFNIDTRPNLVYSIYVNKKTDERRCIDEKFINNDGSFGLDLNNNLGEEWIKITPPLRLTNNKIGCWRWGIPKFENEGKKELILVKENSGKHMFYTKSRLDGENAKYFKYKNIVNNITSSSGTIELVKLLNKKIFDYPKPVKLIKLLLMQGSSSEDLVLDFFSGSATIAQAVNESNIEDGGQRKYIAVQLPELIDNDTVQEKFEYKNICEVAKERIRRAGDKIVSENKDKEGIQDLDIGFKVFKLDSSNIKKWNPSYDNIEQSLDDMEESFVKGRTEEDILYELMLKAGIDITYLVEEVIVSGKKIFNIGFGELLVCLDNDITTDVANEMATLKNDRTKVIFKESGFKDDSAKTNVLEILKRNKIKEVISV